MRITRINKIKNHRIFRDFSWPADLQDFGQFNLIYGWNGSGKTTLSGLFRYLEKRQAITEGEAIFKIDDRLLAGNAIATPTLLPSVRVFNSEFIAASVFASPSPLSPIFFLGEDTVEKQKEIEALKGKLTHATNDLGNADNAFARAEGDLDRYTIAKAQLIRESLSSSGPNQYNNYDKRGFRQKSEAIASGKESGVELSDAERLQLKHQKDASPRGSISPLGADFTDLNALHDAVASLLERKVVSQIMAELTNDVEVSEWVREGLTYHTHAKKSDTCHFCGEQIAAGRIAALEAHFNDEYARFLKELDGKAQDVDIALGKSKAVSLPDQGLFYDHLAPAYGSTATEVLHQQGEIAAYLEALRTALAAKRDQPFKSLPLGGFLAGREIPDPAVERERFDALNDVIKKHNETTANYQVTVTAARQQLEQGYIAEAQQDFKSKTEEVEKAAAKIKEIEGKPRELQEQIAKLEAQIVEHRRPAEELNRELASYLGRNELTFEVKDNGYSLLRNGAPASNLSEGEKTAIAFLYFLKSLQGKGFDLSKDIVVIDDPVSSLDTNSLFCAFGFMRERTKGAGQLFVLTHSFGFFRQVKNWFNHLPGQRKKFELRQGRFYMLESQFANGQRGASLGKLDPLLHQYESEYHYLFSKVYGAVNRVDRPPLEECYSLPNVARRLLEAFLAFRYPSRTGELEAVFNQISFDPAKKARILRFLHTYSHDGKISDPEHDLSILAESKEILVDLLALLESEDEKHVAEMKKLCVPNEEEAVQTQ